MRGTVTISSAQLRMARAALRWRITDLARHAKLASATIGRIEADLAAHRSTLVTLRQVLEQAGVMFVSHTDGDGIRLSHAGECVSDLLFLVGSGAGPAATATAMRARIDRYLADARAWRRYSRVKKGVYANHLEEALRPLSLELEPHARNMLERARAYLVARTTSSRPEFP